jgi:hypothetical protein
MSLYGITMSELTSLAHSSGTSPVLSDDLYLLYALARVWAMVVVHILADHVTPSIR